MLDQWLSIGVGAALVFAAAGLAYLANRLPAGVGDSPPASDDPLQRSEQKLFEHWTRNRRRRRLQVAALLGLVGTMIGLGDAGLIPWQRIPLAFAFYWLAVLGLTVWILFIALGDLLSARLHGRLAQRSLDRLHEKREELLAAADRLRQHREGRSPGQN
jgi:cell division protein FtsB